MLLRAAKQQQNAQSYLPQQALKGEVAQDLINLFNAADRGEADRLLQMAADKHRQAAPKLAEWMEDNVPEGLAVFHLPAAHLKRPRTSNVCERLNKEITLRTRVATLFPNEASLLRLASAVLVETD
ncbi:transposase [Adhaeretor mobilis]|uniref:Mutator family transposase n=1 Tax=Adhaeretor mobilis TaxID=1930276 RepID=A0A517N150_9BACT|nr:transposase [Adhaeretor mobilis]QDT00856.1 Transposase, Mutator family [Adhaeretor mobilis]